MRCWSVPFVIGFAVGCGPKTKPVSATPESPPAPSTGVPTTVTHGAVESGVYVTHGPGFRIPVPVGWKYTEGPADASLQLRVEDEGSGILVEVWRFSGSDLSLRPREGCPWSFEDEGTYNGPGGLQHRTVATCVPMDAQQPRVYAWAVKGADALWQVEGHVPPSELIEGHAAVRWMVERFVLVP